MTAMTAVSKLEIRFGFECMSLGKRRRGLEERFNVFCGLAVASILPFDDAAAERAARYLVKRRRDGNPLDDDADAQIAGIVLALDEASDAGVTLATRNVADFVDVPLINPWDFTG